MFHVVLVVVILLLQADPKWRPVSVMCNDLNYIGKFVKVL